MNEGMNEGMEWNGMELETERNGMNGMERNGLEWNE